MPSNTISPSYLGNITAQRERLSGIRQRLQLESSPKVQAGQMTPVAPSPPNGPAQAPNPGSQALQGDGALMVPEGKLRIPPEKEQAMLQQAAEFLNQWGPQQQRMIEQQRAQSSATAQQQRPPRPGAQVINDPNVIKALSPMAAFFKQNGRLPSPEELQNMKAGQVLAQQLGRAPTDTEIQLAMSKPPKLDGRPSNAV